MTGINEADMNRIEEFVKRSKFERSPDLLCPSEEEAGEDDEEDENTPPPGTR
jgi:hypothetical protein